MPGFVKSPKDEKKWKEAKDAAGKQTSQGSKGFWKLSNFIFHKMKKRETALEKAAGDPAKPFASLKHLSPGNSMKVSNPMKVGDQATVKTPKSKKLPGATDKPSVFFKSEDFGSIKKPSIEKLRSFLEKNRSKR
jgi:hypothetical protein